MKKVSIRDLHKKMEEAPSSLQLTLVRGTETLHRVLSQVSPNDLKHLQGTVNEVDFLVKAAQLAALVMAPLDPTERKLQAARVRGLVRIVKLRRAAEPTLELGEVSKLLGVTRQTIRRKVSRRQLLALPKGGDWVLPAFQFKEGAVLNGLPQVLKALDTDSVFTSLSFLLSENPDFGKKTAIEMLEAGDIEPVVAEARVFLSGRSETGNEPHTRAELLHLHQRVLKRVRKMTPEEGFRSLVASGIYTPEGKLAKEYGG